MLLAVDEPISIDMGDSWHLDLAVVDKSDARDLQDCRGDSS